MITLSINGKSRAVDVPDDMPLLWTLRDVLGMTGTKFGCGMGLCGACTIHIDGQPARSCLTPVSAAAGRKITTIEAIGTTPAGRKIQAAWLATIEAVSGLMNLVMLPMWVLSGVFFSADRYPDAVQPFIRALPLTLMNDALRAVMNEGAGLLDIGWQLIRNALYAGR